MSSSSFMTTLNQSDPALRAQELDIPPSTTVEDDFEVSRKNLMRMMSTTSGAIELLSSLVSQSQDPDTFEVLNKMIENYNKQQEQLLRMHRIKESNQKATQATSPEGQVVDQRTQNVFVGTPADLAKVLEKIKGGDAK
jgi:hypothetical protein